jgi:hypothetical protein
MTDTNQDADTARSTAVADSSPEEGGDGEPNGKRQNSVGSRRGFLAAALAVAGYQYVTGDPVTTLYYVPAFVIIGVGGNLIAGRLEDAAG